MGAIGVIRSLGRAGFAVHAISSQSSALGLRSRYATRGVVAPPCGPFYVAWVRDYVRANQIRAIVPSESFLLSLTPQDQDLRALVPFEAGDEALTRLALSKYDLLQHLMSRGAPHLPPTLLVDLPVLPSAARLEALGLPLYVKTDGCHSLDESRGRTVRAETSAEAIELLRSLTRRFRHAIVQGHVPGRGVGASFLVTDKGLLAEFMHLRLHEVPFTGGVSSLRKSFRHEAILRDAREKLAATGWRGVAMMEYRWDPDTGQFWFVEMNARFWGSLHLALYAGVDFPRLLLDAWRGQPASPQAAYEQATCVHLPLEVQHVWSKLKSTHLSMGDKLGSLLQLCWLALNPAIKKDLLFPGDRMLFWRSIGDFARPLLHRRAPVTAAVTKPSLKELQ